MTKGGSSGPVAPRASVRVHLVKGSHPDVEYPAEVASNDSIHLVVLGTWSEPETRYLGSVRFEPRDVFTEHYWRARWYSVKEVRTPEGDLKGWYYDVCRPVRVEDGVLVSDHLDLDLWVSGDGGTILRLDEDDFRASGLAERDPDAAARARQALDELEALAAGGFSEL